MKQISNKLSIVSMLFSFLLGSPLIPLAIPFSIFFLFKSAFFTFFILFIISQIIIAIYINRNIKYWREKYTKHLFGDIEIVDGSMNFLQANEHTIDEKIILIANAINFQYKIGAITIGSIFANTFIFNIIAFSILSLFTDDWYLVFAILLQPYFLNLNKPLFSTNRLEVSKEFIKEIIDAKKDNPIWKYSYSSQANSVDFSRYFSMLTYDLEFIDKNKDKAIELIVKPDLEKLETQYS
jgi:hypothetical protein